MVSNYFKTLINRHLRNNPGLSAKAVLLSAPVERSFPAWNERRDIFSTATPPIRLSRVRLENYFADKARLLEKNISARFRSPEQFLMTSLAYHLEILDGNRQTEKLGPRLSASLLFQKTDGEENKALRNRQDIKFVCAQSLDMFSPEERERIFGWLNKIIGHGEAQINQFNATGKTISND